MHEDEAIQNAVEHLAPICGENCKVGLILGSGLGEYAERIQNKQFVNYSELCRAHGPAGAQG